MMRKNIFSIDLDAWESDLLSYALSSRISITTDPQMHSDLVELKAKLIRHAATIEAALTNSEHMEVQQ